jgi:hypothetical protein
MKDMEKKAQEIGDRIDIINESIIFSDSKIEHAISKLEELEETEGSSEEEKEKWLNEVKLHYSRIKMDKRELLKIEAELY